MNPIGNTNPVGGEDQRFDLLVDGELSEEDRRTLLGQLDREPGSWRRCALAFLEAQMWKQEFGVLLQPATEAASSPQPAGRSFWNRQMPTLLAMAASFLIALVLGMALRGGGASLPGSRPSLGNMATMTTQALPGPRTPGQDPAAAANPWQMVTLTASDGAQEAPESFELPVRSGTRLDPQWLQSLPAPVPSDVVQALRDSGHQIEQRRELVPVPMRDGRRLVVPVDQVDIHYVGRPAL